VEKSPPCRGSRCIQWVALRDQRPGAVSCYDRCCSWAQQGIPFDSCDPITLTVTLF
jgi:hypothetical protein